jgi:hypothetical protein
MKASIILIPVVTLWAVAGQVDVVCQHYCSVLEVRNGVVQFTDGFRRINISRYVAEDQQLVPRTEAPTNDLRSQRGWRVVVSAVLDHQELREKLRLRFFDPSGVLRLQHDVLMVLEHQQIGRLFGSADEVVAITSNEEHAYNSRTDVWFLPKQGDPKHVLSVAGGFQALSDSRESPGLVVFRQTYDGVHSETKGFIREEYAWDTGSTVFRLHSR